MAEFPQSTPHWRFPEGTVEHEAETMLHTCEHITELTEGQHLYDTEFVLRLCRAVLSERGTPDQGTEKLLRDLLDRGYKMHVMAGTTRVAAQDSDHNDPLIAWLSDVRSVLYGNTKPEPRGLT